MKKTIRMNERELHRMISESVKRVLMEGKIVNNRPFMDYADDLEYVGNSRREMRDKHISREMANKSHGRTPEQLCNSNRYNREFMAKMLRFYNMTADEFFQLPEDERDDMKYGYIEHMRDTEPWFGYNGE